MKTTVKTRLWIAAMVYPSVNAVIFGFAVVAMLSIPTLNEMASTLFYYVVPASFVASAPIAWMLAPRLRARYWRGRETAQAPLHV